MSDLPNCICGHKFSVHYERPNVEEIDDGDVFCHSEDVCGCFSYRPAWPENSLFNHPLECKHQHMVSRWLKKELFMHYSSCDKVWIGIPQSRTDDEIFEMVKDAFIEGRDEDAWSILKMAFE